jgi:CheY-like chemotaxis protein
MKKITVIDQNNANRKIIFEFAKQVFGYVYTIEIFDGQKAIEIIEQDILSDVDICFINLSLPLVDGQTVSNVLKIKNPMVRQVALTCNESLNGLELINFSSVIKLGESNTMIKIKNEFKL